MRTLLCYGDSNTWGTVPVTESWEVERYGLHVRWPGVLRDQLGEDYWVIEEGLGGRTTIHDDPYEPHRNGLTYLHPCLLTHNPIDLVILKLGTNNLKHRFGLSAYDIAASAGVLVETILKSECGPAGGSPQVLLICPPPVVEVGVLEEMFEGGAAKSAQLAPYYQRVTENYECAFLDAGELISVSVVDGIHYEAEAHRILGEAVATKVREIFQ
ncbi:MAG: SGNH/GDSL hydrolase family protein [Anaerolineae bacterium]|nr:SGNH/GDSL hydrolase family protein [Anaerolineae bacterium]